MSGYGGSYYVRFYSMFMKHNYKLKDLFNIGIIDCKYLHDLLKLVIKFLTSQRLTKVYVVWGSRFE